MYVVDMDGNIIIGTRGPRTLPLDKRHMPHPTLIGGENPQVLTAGEVNIRGGKIYKINNQSGHFQPSTESIEVAKEAFGKLPNGSFAKDFEGYFVYDPATGTLVKK